MNKFLLISIIILSTSLVLFAQEIKLEGFVFDSEDNKSLELVTVYIPETNVFTETNKKGFYSIKVPINTEFEIQFRRLAYETQTLNISFTEDKLDYNVFLSRSANDIEIEVTEDRIEDGTIREQVIDLERIPTTTGNLESLLPHIGLGVSSGTGGELSSQYNVRGGNFDENLIYVNGFQIYRPQLIRSSQQEGLTFANLDLVGTLSFSSGGFEALYGDKLSSVLDINYKSPTKHGGSLELSALGGSAHYEGAFLKNDEGLNRLKVLVGARYKTTRYLLGTLETQGEYIPNFSDFQSYITYEINPKWQVAWLANYNKSVYNFRPETRSTAFGLINFALQLNSVFTGQEMDDFTTAMTGISINHIPNPEKQNSYVKLLVSGFRSLENERRDILGFYRLGESSRSLTGEGSDEIARLLGTGTQHNYTRNYLSIDVGTVAVRGGLELFKKPEKKSEAFLEYGVQWQKENIEDSINEWERLDSAGYSLNYNEDTVKLLSVLKSDINLQSNRYESYAQVNYQKKTRIGNYEIIAGLRASYWDVNQEFLISPRAKFLFQPSGNKDISYRLSAGYYMQAPFYRELRDPQGQINTSLLGQKSMHFVGGLTYDFKWGSRPKKFRFISEIYYKKLWDLVSYEVDNVRIRYSGQNDATGYVLGADFRVNGEFVSGAESWFNVSILAAREKLDGVEHLRREIGDTIPTTINYVPRPSDQAVRASIFFQDYLPKNENIKTHLNFTFGTGLPFGLRDNNRIYRNTYRFPIYHRTDIGFSFQLWNDEWRAKRPKHFLSFTKSTWLSLEIYNLMQVRNEASKTWIKTIFRQQYAVPNYLTSRRVNLKLKFNF